MGNIKGKAWSKSEVMKVRSHERSTIEITEEYVHVFQWIISKHACNQTGNTQ